MDSAIRSFISNSCITGRLYAPIAFCSCSYVEHANLLYVATTLIDLHERLAIVLRW
ncbi:hypothetical protein I4U23_023630 [Adineta vaga]|nr:hypothetical protein I4U23_023630 [Adineta vaga]